MALLARALTSRNQITVLTSETDGLPAESVEGGLRVVHVPVLARRRASSASLLSMASYLPAASWQGLHLARRTRYDEVNSPS